MNTNEQRDSVGWAVYEITHRKSGKSYVGQSKSPIGRWQFHALDAFVNGKQYPISRDLRKEGIEAFDFRVLERCASEEEAKDREKWHIAQRVNAGRSLYNVLLTEKLGYGQHGEGNPYVKCSCRFGHVCRQGQKRRHPSRKPTARAHKVTPQVYDVMCRLHDLDVHMRKIADALDVSVGTVHWYVGRAR